MTVVDPPRFPERSDPAGAKEVEVHDRIEQPTQPIDVSGYQELPLPAVDPAPRAPAPPAPLALPNAVKPQPLFASLLFPEDHGDPRSEPRPPAIAPAAAPRIEVALPANVLIIDDDTRAASAVAAKLLEHGYGCKIARSDGASLALSREHFDAVVIEIPPEEARKSLGKERLGVLADFHGPAIVTSAAVLRLDLLRATPQVRAVLTKPYFVEVLVQSIEAARVPFSTDLSAPERRSAPLEPKRAAPVATAASPVPAAPSSSPPGPALVPIERRSARRHELDVNVVRVVISGPGVQTVRGRVRNLSNNGGMLIDTSIRLPLKTPVTAELTLFDGRMMIFSGRVVRTMSNDLAIRFDVDDTQHAFLDLYIAEARAPNQRAIQPLRVSMREQGTTEDIIDDMMLMKRWLEVSERIEDDDIQQRFIQDCLKAERIEFAVARYRELKLQRPEDERVAKYLQQIGTILSFYAFQKKDPAQKERPKIPASLKIVIGIFILAGIALGLILQRAMH